MASKREIPIEPATTTSPKPLSSFNRIAKAAFLYEPPQCATPYIQTAPTTILLCSWLNASPKHIQYYTKNYTARFPHARIIVTKISTRQFLLESETKRRQDTKGAVDAILARPQEGERLLVHTLSNGGAKRLYGVAAAYREVTGKPLPARAVIFDSSPGVPRFRRDIHALRFGAEKLGWLAWVPYMMAAYFITMVVYVCVNWLPKWVWKELVWAPTEGMSGTQLVQKCAAKGFVYSKEDKAMSWEDVEAFAKVVEENGSRTVKKRIEGAQHVQMFKGKGGEEDYWGFRGKHLENGSGVT